MAAEASVTPAGSNPAPAIKVQYGIRFSLELVMWIVVNIGCIECGVSTNIVGVFDNKERAEAIAAEFSEKFSWREGGQNEFEVFSMPEVNVIASEYVAKAE